jgi:ABC-2 type transport system permease protein
MTPLLTCIRRELQEHRTIFLTVPAIITLFLSLMLAGLLLMSGLDLGVSVDYDIDEGANGSSQGQFEGSMSDLLGEGLAGLIQQPEGRQVQVFNQIFLIVAAPLGITLWIMVFFYLLGALYDDRIDRSVLFWKSMPVSDSLTVLSKVVTGMIAAPVIFLLFIMVLHLVLLIVMWIGVSDQPIDPWADLLSSSHVLQRWMMLVLVLVTSLVWCLPAVGWLLLVSAWARSVPFLWAVGIPIAVSLVERAFTNSQVISGFLLEHAVPQTSRAATLDFPIIESAIALATGLALLTASIWFRARADEL